MDQKVIIVVIVVILITVFVLFFPNASPTVVQVPTIERSVVLPASAPVVQPIVAAPPIIQPLAAPPAVVAPVINTTIADAQLPIARPRPIPIGLRERGSALSRR